MARILAFDLSPAEWMGLSRGSIFQELVVGGLVDVRRKGGSYLLHVSPEDEPHVREKLKSAHLNEQERVFSEGLAAIQRARV